MIRRLLLLLILLSAANFAYVADPKNEVGLLLGGITTPDRNIVPGPGTINVSTGITYQAIYARLLKQTERVGIYFEVPFVATPLQDVSSTNPAVPLNYASLFITPGVKFKFRPQERVSPFVAVGGGYARFDESEDLVSGVPNPGPRGTNTGVFQFGGGFDVKVFSRISLRGEVRDFYSGRPQFNVATDSDRQHNVVFSGGFVIHF
ncbi:MAG: outer membrane protein [Terriglobales bacterium]